MASGSGPAQNDPNVHGDESVPSTLSSSEHSTAAGLTNTPNTTLNFPADTSKTSLPDRPENVQEANVETSTEPQIPSAEPALPEKDDQFLKFWEGVLDRNRSSSAINNRANNAWEYRMERERRVPLDLRRGSGGDLAFLSQSYLRLIEDRITELEDAAGFESTQRRRSIGQISQRVDSIPQTPQFEPTYTHPEPNYTQPGVMRLFWEGFKRKYSSKTITSEEHTLDVLIGEAVIPHHVWKTRFLRTMVVHLNERDLYRRRYVSSMATSEKVKPKAAVNQEEAKELRLSSNLAAFRYDVQPESYTPMPDRVRINGTSLIELLHKKIDNTFPHETAPLVILKPFKIFVYHEKAIRNVHGQLARRFKNKSTPALDQVQKPSRDRNAESGSAVREPLDPHGDTAGDETIDDGDDGSETSSHDGVETEQAYKELDSLVYFLDSALHVLENFREGNPSKIYFSDLWHIFSPGVKVVTSAEKSLNAYRVVHATGGRDYLSPPEVKNGLSFDREVEDFAKSYRVLERMSPFAIDCYYMDFDGMRYGPIAKAFEIQKYDGLREITSLPVYPIKFSKDRASLEQKLTERGQKFLQVSRGEHRQYKGPNLREQEVIDSQIIIDFERGLWDRQDKDLGWDFKFEFGLRPPHTANAAEVTMVSDGGCSVTSCCENDLIFNDIDLDRRRMDDYLADRSMLTKDARYLPSDPTQIPEADLALFPNRLFAFVLRDRKWALVDIDSVRDVPRVDDSAGWNSLVLPKGHKDMVYSLVHAHFAGPDPVSSQDEILGDLVRGKGRGLIILLHGAPGVGKTSTAECVADFCRKPLYPITCGDLGITAEEVESRLKRIFVQAQKWKCVLLLDEADVFLSERGDNFKRNSMVSVFLRILEYYHGILFLTTNRVGKIDEAFKSRVHISLYYPPLNDTSTKKVFNVNIDRVEKSAKKMRVKYDEIGDFVEAHSRLPARERWNGRQIRNAFHIATALAENEARTRSVEKGTTVNPCLRARHFELVEDASMNFDAYLYDVLKMGHSDRAAEHFLRADSFKETSQGNPNMERFPENRPGTRKRQSKRRTRRDSSESDEELYDKGARGDLSGRRGSLFRKEGGNLSRTGTSSRYEETSDDEREMSRGKKTRFVPGGRGDLKYDGEPRVEPGYDRRKPRDYDADEEPRMNPPRSEANEQDERERDDVARRYYPEDRKTRDRYPETKSKYSDVDDRQQPRTKRRTDSEDFN